MQTEVGKGFLTLVSIYRNSFSLFVVACLTQINLGLSSQSFADTQEDFTPDGDYRRATDDPENVKDKLFPKIGKVELQIPDVGYVTNTPFVNTFLVHGGLVYYPSEVWGLGIEGSMGIVSDKQERTCLETFYNDPTGKIGPECGDGHELDNQTSNYGPVYMPIREIKYIVAGNAIWNPIYGKQLLLLSATSYFDVFAIMGAGVVISDFYAEKTTLNNGKKSRATYNEVGGGTNGTSSTLDGGARTDEPNSYGVAGRPTPISETHPMLNLGFGQRYHFLKRFHLRFEIRDFLLIGTPGGFENYVVLLGGFGMRF